jgi:hypothetical protein
MYESLCVIILLLFESLKLYFERTGIHSSLLTALIGRTDGRTNSISFSGYGTTLSNERLIDQYYAAT